MTIAIWSYKEGRSSGVSGGDPEQRWKFDLQRYGHAITKVGQDPWNHHVIGFGVGHDDASFAESGRSMAAYYENGERLRWWEDTAELFSIGVRYYGLPCGIDRPHICDGETVRSHEKS